MEEETMTTIVALPVAAGRLSLHFGHCENFAFFEVDRDTGAIARRWEAEPPPHEPGVLPRWLQEQGAGTIIAGGMGRRAQDLFASAGIEVLVGAPSGIPEALVGEWLAGGLEGGTNICDH
jgi:predicted Fe-Mo cluster-binding NifX family protein